MHESLDRLEKLNDFPNRFVDCFLTVFSFGKFTVFDRQSLSFVDFLFPTDLGRLHGGTARCLA